MKSLFDESVCPNCNFKEMHEVERDDVVIRFCGFCGYEFRFKKRRIEN